MIEYYYGVRIDKDYPILKRFNQTQALNKIFELDMRRQGLIR